MKTTNLAEADGLPPIEWSQVEPQLADLLTHDDPQSPNRVTFWLTTLNADGSPHVTSVGALWHVGSCWFQTGEHTRKAKNIARDPRCTVSVATKGFDVMVSGEAQRVADPKIVAEIAALWARRFGNRHHRALQRADAWTAAVVRLRGQTAHRDRSRYHRGHTGFNALAVLKVEVLVT
jgi:general stress protein 26